MHVALCNLSNFIEFTTQDQEYATVMASEKEMHEDFHAYIDDIEKQVQLQVKRTRKACKTLEREVATFKEKERDVQNLLKHMNPEKIERLEAFHESFKALCEMG